MPICQNCGSYFARKELGCPNCKSKEQETKYLTNLEQELKENKDSLAKVKETYQQDVDTLKDQLLDLESKLKEENENINLLISELASVEKQQDIVAQKIQETRQNISQVEADFAQLSKEREKLQNYDIELSTDLQTIQTLIDEKKNSP